jgi:hypothetical protein
MLTPSQIFAPWETTKRATMTIEQVANAAVAAAPCTIVSSILARVYLFELMN